MPPVQIDCHGRRYPNAPAITKGGCLERPPPYYFFPFTAGFTGPPAAINGVFVPMRWNHISPTSGFDVDSWWLPDPDITWGTIELTLAHPNIGTGYPQTWHIFINYRGPGKQLFYIREFPNGFPKWPDFYQIDYHHDINWDWGKPAIVNLWIGSYALCPVGLCK